MDRCEWREDWEGNWETGCDEAFVFIAGGPAENGMVYCPYCGLVLVPIPHADDESEGE